MLPIIRPLTADERQLVGETWAARAESEVRSTQRFAALASALRAHSATPTVIGLCDRAVKDEERHVGLCAKVAEEFGVKPELEGIRRPGPLAPQNLPIRARVLYEVVAVCCINETINATLLAHVYENTKWPSIRLTAHTLVGDEIWHSRMGWAHLGSEMAEVPVGWLSDHIVPLLEMAGAHEIFHAPHDGREAPHMADYGELNYETRIRLFKEIVNTVLLPGFESFGIDITEGRAWIKAIAESAAPRKRSQ